MCFAVAVVALNWARHPGRRRRPEPGSPEALQKRLGAMDRILVALGIFLFLFVVTMIVLFWKFQTVPDVLIGAVFGFCGFECGAMAAIQRRKTAIREKLREKSTKESEEKTP